MFTINFLLNTLVEGSSVDSVFPEEGRCKETEPWAEHEGNHGIPFPPSLSSLRCVAKHTQQISPPRLYQHDHIRCVFCSTWLCLQSYHFVTFSLILSQYVATDATIEHSFKGKPEFMFLKSSECKKTVWKTARPKSPPGKIMERDKTLT